MKTPSIIATRAALAFLVALPLSAVPPSGTLYWGASGSGGTGAWEDTNAWWNGSAPLTWVSGTDGTVQTYINFVFSGTGRDAGDPYVITTALSQIASGHPGSTPESHTVLFDFRDNYLFNSTIGTGTTVLGTVASAGKVTIRVDEGKTVSFDGGTGGIRIASAAGFTAESTVLFSGNGTINLGRNVSAADTQASGNGRVAVGNVVYSGTNVTLVNAPVVNMNDETTNITAHRLYVDAGTLNINSGTILMAGTQRVSGTSYMDSQPFHIGEAVRHEAVPEASRAVVNLNGGYIYSSGSHAGYNGLVFAYYNTKNSVAGSTIQNNGAGGTFNLNGGVFETSNIYANPDATNATTRFVFNGGTLRTAAAASSAQLGAFIAGFKTSAEDGTGRKALVTGTGGAFIDTGAITGKTAVILSEIQGSGNFVKLGANTLLLTATQTYTGTTIVREGTLNMNVVDAIAASRAVVVESDAALNGSGGGITQTLRNLSGSGTLLNGSGRLIAFNDAGESSTFAGSFVLGSGGFGKAGAGTLFLTADNSAVTRATLVTAGKLLLGDAAGARLGGLVTVENGATFGGLGAATGTVALAAGGILQSGTGAAAGTLTVGTLQLDAGAILGFSLGAGNAASRLDVTHPVVFLSSASAAGITINLDALISGTYALGGGSLAGALAGASGTAAVTYAGAPVGGRQSAILTGNAGSLQLALDAGSSLKVIWTGATDAVWNTTGTNWKKDGDAGAVPFATGDAVVFDDSLATGRRDITLASAITVSEMTVGGTGSYAFTGHAITADAAQAPGLPGAAGRLVMEGTGTLTLAPAGANDFKGGIDLKAGALRAAADGALGAGALNVLGDAALLVDTAALAAGGTVNFAAGKTLALAAAAGAAATFSGKITGGGTLAKTGAGALTLAGANDHAATVLSAGTLAFGHNAALGPVLAAADTAGGGATLRSGLADFAVATAMRLGAHTLTFDTGANNGAWAGAITGGGTLAKTGAGTLEINAAALAATAGLDLAQGKVRLVQTAAGNYTLANKITSPAASASPAASPAAAVLAVRLAGASSGTLALAPGAGVLSGFAGTLAVEDAAFALDAASAAEFSTAALGVGAGSRVSKAAGDIGIAGLALGGGTLQLAMDGLSPDGLLTVGALDTGAAGTETAVVMDLGAGGGGGFAQFNPAVPPAANILDHDNGGATGEKIIAVTGAITGAGALRLTGADGSPLAGAITSVIEQYVPGGGGALKENVADATYSAALVTGADGVYLGSALTAVSVYDGKQLVLDNTAPGVDGAFTAGIGGAGGLEVRAGGAITLSGSNTYTGATTLAAGVTRAARADVFKDSASVRIDAGAAFETGGHAQTLRHLAGGGALDLGGAALTLEVADGGAAEFAGALAGAGAITKTGGGTLTLSGSSARGAGTTAIAAGRLVVKNNFSALGAGAASFSSSTAVLEFSGIASGTFNLAVTGGGIVEVRDSNFAFGNSGNRLTGFNLVNSTVLPTSSVHALGSTTARVRVDSTSALYVSYGHSTTANALRVGGVTVAAGGKLLYGLNGAVNKFDLTGGVLTLEDGAVIGFAGPVADGIYDLVEEGTGVIDRQGALILERGPNKMVQWRATDNGDIELVTLSFDPTVQVSMTFDAMMAAMSAVYARMSESFLLPVVEADRAAKINGLWLRGFASSAEYDETPGQYGHTEDTHGVLTGFDALSKDRRYLMGVYGGFAGGTLKTGAGARGGADRQFAGLYGAARWGRLYAGIDGMAGWSKTANTRRQSDGGVSEGTGKANYHGGSIEAGLVFRPAGIFTLKPSAGLHYLNAGFDAFKERGDNAIAYPDIDQDILQSRLALQGGWKFTMPWGWPAMADLSYAWRRNISEKSGDVTVRFVADTTQAPYVIRAGDYVRGGHVIGGGIRCVVNDALSLGLAWDIEFASHRVRHTANGTLRWSW